MLFRESAPAHRDSFSYTVTGLRPWSQYEFSIRAHNPAGHTSSPWVAVTTKQAPPRGLAPPTVRYIKEQPSKVWVAWTPPSEPNGILQSYRIHRNNVSFSFSFDPTVLNYTDEDLLPFSTYRCVFFCLQIRWWCVARHHVFPPAVFSFSFAITACTSEGCITSAHTNITTLEAAPASVEPPTVDSFSSTSMDVSWSKPLTQTGDVTQYTLKLNNQPSYRGTNQNTVLSGLQPHTAYQLVLSACTNGGCTTSTPITVVTEEAPPTNLSAPTLKVNWLVKKISRSTIYSKTMHTKHVKTVFFTFLTMIRCRWQVLSPWRLAGLHQNIQMVSSVGMSSAEMVKSSMSAQRRATTTLRFHQMWNTVTPSGPTTAKVQRAARQPLQRLTRQPHLESVCQRWRPWDQTRFLRCLFSLTSHLLFQPVSCSWLFALPGESAVEFSSSP